jgi:kynurenine formamidase
VIDLTASTLVKAGSEARSETRIIALAALASGTWSASQIPPERLIGPLVIMDLNASSGQISIEDIANWEAHHGHVPLGAIVGVRGMRSVHRSVSDSFPVSAEAIQFLMDARYTRGFIIETEASLGFDRALSPQIALHGNYIIDGSVRLAALPDTGSLIIVTPENERQCPKESSTRSGHGGISTP